jgi:multimeric flavodoxin WrbA
MNVLVIHTTTHDPSKSTSWAMGGAVIDEFKRRSPGSSIRLINSNDLHIVQNLSCYASGKRDCANPASGPYRCWAHYDSLKNPAKYGGVDHMPVIYDGIQWADIIVFTSSTRWGSHSALAQKIIERMDTLENRAASWGEANPLHGKRMGVLMGGLHWRTGEAAVFLGTVFREMGFTVPPGATLAWQRSRNPNFEHPDQDRPYVLAWLSSEEGKQAVRMFVDALEG